MYTLDFPSDSHLKYTSEISKKVIIGLIGNRIRYKRHLERSLSSLKHHSCLSSLSDFYPIQEFPLENPRTSPFRNCLNISIESSLTAFQYILVNSYGYKVLPSVHLDSVMPICHIFYLKLFLCWSRLSLGFHIRM